VKPWLFSCIYIFISRIEFLFFWWQIFQEKLHGHKCSEDGQDSGKVREWLELQIKSTEFDVVKNALWQKIKNLKGNANLSDLNILPLQEEEAKRTSKEIVSIITVL
jgi:hypothetical protein